MRAQWRVADADVTTRQALAAATGLSPLFCQVLINRGITEAAAAQAFLTPSLHDLHDPYRLHGMEQAVQRLVTAIRQGERIAIYGDYDVDGVTATALHRPSPELEAPPRFCRARDHRRRDAVTRGKPRYCALWSAGTDADAQARAASAAPGQRQSRETCWRG